MTSTSSANATGLPSNVVLFPGSSNRAVPVLDPRLVAALALDKWTEIGVTCRVALWLAHMTVADHDRAIDHLLDEEPGELKKLIEDRQRHRKTLLSCLVALRAAERRGSASLDRALTARGH